MKPYSTPLGHIKPILEYRSVLWATGIIAAILLSVMLIYTSRSTVLAFTPDTGAWEIATNLVNGRGYTGCRGDYFPFCNSANQTTAMREPVPVLLMALTMLITHFKYADLILQSLFYLGTMLVIYTILKNDDRRAALLAAFLWAVSIPVIKELNNDSSELVAAFFFSLGLLFFLKGYKEQKTRDWVASGIFMGLASLSRSVLLGVSGGLVIALLFTGLRDISRSWKERLAPASLFLIAIGLILAPWIIRNDIVFGVPVIGSTLAGYNIFRMNFIIANNTFFPHYVGPSDAYQAVMNLIQKSNLTGRENETQMQSFYLKAGLQIIAQHPFRYISLSLYRFLVLWFNTSVKTAYDLRLNLKDYIATIQQSVFLIAVVIGSAKNQKKYWPLILSLVLGCGAYMAVSAQLRYLVDLMQAVVILSALAISGSQFLIKRKSSTPVLRG